MSNTIKIRDNRYVISPRNKEVEALIKKVEEIEPKGVVNGLHHLTPTPVYRMLKLMKELKELGYDFSVQQPQVAEQPTPQTVKKHKHKKKDKKKHHKYKDKKGAKKMSKHISYNLTERNERSSNLMAELLKKADCLSIIDNSLWVYNQKTGCFDNCNADDISAKLRMLLDEKDRLKVSSQEYKEAFNQLMISEELTSEEGFFANKPFVNCVNGVVDVRNGKLLPHSSSYKFKHYIRAKYNPEAKCKEFLKFVRLITNEDDELIRLLQAVMGYVISHYNNAKTAFLFFGPTDTGKSVICKILAEIIGEDYVSHSDLADLHKQEFAASLFGMILNIAPDLKNGALKDVGFFKSLTSHNDTISARLLYANPTKVKGETKMLFCSNHLLSFDGTLDTGDIDAVFNRFIYFPFQNQSVPKEKDRKNLSSELLEEKDGIFTWAMEGLKNYIENGENFPYSKLSHKIKAKNMARYCPEKTFFEKCLVIDESACESTKIVNEAYEAYCKANEVETRGNIRSYISKHKKIEIMKKRINANGNLLSSGNPRATYVGIRLKDKYRVN